jgi:phosphoserine phosphatase
MALGYLDGLLEDVHYYGDSLPDVHVLERVGHPVAVNPMPGLRTLARERGWRVWDFSNELVS